MTTPEALAIQLRMVADLVETTAKVIGDARFRDVPGLHDGFGDAKGIIAAEPAMVAAMRSLANWVERPSPAARKFARENTEQATTEDRP